MQRPGTNECSTTDSSSNDTEHNCLTAKSQSIVHKNLPGYQGRYQVRMVPYQDAEFSQPFAGNVNVEVNEQMFVEIRVEGVDSRQFATVVDTCWATPENDPHHSVRWDLISGECPSSNDDTVELLQNGVSTSSRFSFRMFVFTVNSTKVYLHCSVHLCLLTGNHCSIHCDSGYHRRQGSNSDTEHDYLTACSRSNSNTEHDYLTAWSRSNSDTEHDYLTACSRSNSDTEHDYLTAWSRRYWC
ncbi:pancreatic secretory granule membrane major glyco GP2-like protein [Labeo rohita]|uniref:Pancreatic secretory granule membrane major glyco GP2-like protein n=1 Tax=Labeo rohita TaxID=84645 RepID=A0A498P1R0_LABRO|nr:pancreatic secretory granule membrane major glyco GP2-like protein [Labeo rohita]